MSISADYARPLLEELARLGGNLELLWRQAAIKTPLSAVMNGAAAVLPAAEFTRIYRYSAGELERRCCAREGRRPMGKAAVDMLCYCVIHSKTLREAILRAADFNAILEERGGELRLQERRSVVHFTMHVSGRERDSATLLVDLTGLYFYYKLFSWLIGSRIQLAEVCVAYDAPSRPHPLLDVLGVPLQFSQPDNTLSFPARYLEQRVVRSDEELKRVIDYFPFDFSFGGPSPPCFSAHLHLLFVDALQHQSRVPELETVAQLLHMSPATLRRRLTDEGTSYSELRASSQQEMAQYLLRQTGLPMEEIAARLGFGSERAFRRAFAEWTGETPGTWRGRLEADQPVGVRIRSQPFQYVTSPARRRGARRKSVPKA